MHEAAAAETEELIEVQQQEAEAEAASEAEPELIPDPPETVVGVVHELGSIAAICEQNTKAVADLESQMSALRAEMAGIARVEAEHLLDTILEEAESGEADEEATEQHAPRNASWWERMLAG